MGNNEPFRDVDYLTTPVTVGPFFDCANPVNDSIKNTGLRNLPPAKAPDMWYGYTQVLGPGRDPGRRRPGPDGRPVLRLRRGLDVGHEVPAVLRRQGLLLRLGQEPRLDGPARRPDGKVEKVNRFMPNTSFLAPQSLAFGPDGSLYALEWGGGFGRDNPNSGIYRIDYINGSRSPVAVGPATPDNGQEPLTVTFSSVGSADPEGGALTYAWDFDGDGTTDSTVANPTHQYTTPGVYQARLTVTDPAGKTGTTVIVVTVGNTKPTVKFNGPVNGGFVDWGDRVNWDVDGHRRRGHGRLRRPDRAARARARRARAPAARVPRQDRLGRHRPRQRPLGGHEGVLRARRPLHRQGRRQRAGADGHRHGDPAAQAQGGRARRRHARHRHGRRHGRRRGPDAGADGLGDGDWAVVRAR